MNSNYMTYNNFENYEEYINSKKSNNYVKEKISDEDTSRYLYF